MQMLLLYLCRVHIEPGHVEVDHAGGWPALEDLVACHVAVGCVALRTSLDLHIENKKFNDRLKMS